MKDVRFFSFDNSCRIKELKVKPYTLEEAYAAGGSGTNDFYGSFQMKVQ